MNPMDQKGEEGRLDRLFAAYRDACPDLDGSPNFVPRVWEAIEQSKPVGWIFPMRLWAQRLIMATGLAAALMVSYLAFLQKSIAPSPITEAGYADALTAESLDEIDAEFWYLAENNR
jgi:hypothetical protein